MPGRRPALPWAQRIGVTLAICALAFTSTQAQEASQFSELKRDEQIIFYPTLAWPAADGSNWHLRVHGSVFEREGARMTLFALRSALSLKGVKMSKAEAATFKERARLFFVDNERNHRVVIQVGDQSFDLGESGANGHFEKTIQLDSLPGATAGVPRPEFVKFTAVLKSNDTRQFTGAAVVMADQGVSVVSDVDDTIKISEVLNKQTLMRKTFLQPFEAVPGMAEVYRHWATNGATFHYVSASPWQLHPPLREFARTNGFPDGSWHMKLWRVKDRTFASLFGDPQAYKVATIGALMRQFPGRAFVLVGDSGERDPEAYAELARQFPTQVKAIYIRDVTGEPATAERYRTNFAGMLPTRWKVFKEPAEIEPLFGEVERNVPQKYATKEEVMRIVLEEARRIGWAESFIEEPVHPPKYGVWHVLVSRRPIVFGGHASAYVSVDGRLLHWYAGF